MLVGVNGLLALEAIDKQMLQGLLDKSIRLEGSGRPLLLHHKRQRASAAVANDVECVV